jgi:Diacylglycerol kinase catalytic domain
MPKIGLISNPQSQRNRRGLDEIGAAVKGIPEVIHIATDEREHLDEALRELARQEVDVLLISGGDGTVQTVLTRLFEGASFERMPYLAILPRGMANTTAADVGLRGKAAVALARLIAASRDGTLAEHVVERPILRVENLPGDTSQRGMMFGAGAITDVIEFCCREIYARGLQGKLGMSVALAGLLLGAVVGRGGNGVLRSHVIGVALDRGQENRADRLLVLATTLDRLMLWSRPFWNYDDRPIRYTGIAYPPEHLVRSAPKVLYGWRRQTLPPEVYHSQGAWRIAVRVDAPFTVDGEMFQPLPEQPVVITAADRARFVRP